MKEALLIDTSIKRLRGGHGLTNGEWVCRSLAHRLCAALPSVWEDAALPWARETAPDSPAPGMCSGSIYPDEWHNDQKRRERHAF